MEAWMLKPLYTVATVAICAVYGLLLGATMARTMAKVQGRIGIPIWQPFIDIIKNGAKRTGITHGFMFYLGPVFRIAGGIGTLVFIPVIYGSEFFSNYSVAGDLLLVMYFIFFGQLGMALGAGEGGHPYSPIGISRGLAQMTAFEVPFALSVIAIAVQYGTLNITEIVAAQQGGMMSWTFFTNPLAVIAAMIAMLGMNMYPPFSIVLAPQEIPIGPPTEYHSAYLGMLQTNRAIFGAAKLLLFMNLYFGGADNIFMMVFKTWAIYMVTIIVGAAFPRYRPEETIRFFLKWPTLIGIGGLIVSKVFYS